MSVVTTVFSPAVAGHLILNLLGGYASSYGLTMQVPSVPLAPPKIAFPIAWTILYILLAVVAGNLPTQLTTLLYFSQLGLNFIWSTVYFGVEWKLLSLAIIICILIISVILATMLRQLGLDWYLYPYIIWLVYAMYLNAASIKAIRV